MARDSEEAPPPMLKKKKKQGLETVTTTLLFWIGLQFLLFHLAIFLAGEGTWVLSLWDHSKPFRTDFCANSCIRLFRVSGWNVCYFTQGNQIDVFQPFRDT
mmetsp:Transcript_2137/g.4952  ORF Transcript_2137/g.4952 Transcript_2137/m.4952 type:complete len:101 (+) Transcript_2137:554-856(+)